MNAEPSPNALISLTAVDQQWGEVAEALLDRWQINGEAEGLVQFDGSELELAAPLEGRDVEVMEGGALVRQHHWKSEEDHGRRKEQWQTGREEKENTRIVEGLIMRMGQWHSRKKMGQYKAKENGMVQCEVRRVFLGTLNARTCARIEQEMIVCIRSLSMRNTGCLCTKANTV